MCVIGRPSNDVLKYSRFVVIGMQMLVLVYSFLGMNLGIVLATLNN